MRIKAQMVLAALIVSGCAVTRVDPLSVPLAYTSNPKNAASVGALQCNAISQLEVTDGRTDKTLGVRVLENNTQSADVTTTSNVADWVQTGLQTVLSQNRFSLGSGPKLSVTVDSLRTHESVWHRAGYDGRIALTARLQSPSGKVCWNETVQGRGGNYGYAGNALNYQETLNEALDGASLNLVQLPAFKDTLCKCGS